jgi:hypothetical protein
MVIKVRTVSEYANTTEQGLQMQAALRVAFRRPGAVVLSFEGVSTATSSFVNAAIVPLLDTYALDDIKARLRVRDSTRQINAMIRQCVDRPASRALAGASPAPLRSAIAYC